MAPVMHKLTERNLKAIRDCDRLPYSTRRLATKVLEERQLAQLRAQQLQPAQQR
jgi:hypothetical protein